MVDSKKIVTFTQTTNSCVMASYGVTANYFAGIEIRNFFNDYCKHFDIQKFNLTQYVGQVKITNEKSVTKIKQPFFAVHSSSYIHQEKIYYSELVL